MAEVKMCLKYMRKAELEVHALHSVSRKKMRPYFYELESIVLSPVEYAKIISEIVKVGGGARLL